MSNEQTCWVWCPYCRTELTKYGKVIYDDPYYDTVLYECPACGALPMFNFGPPVPIYLGNFEHIHLREDDE